MEREFYFHENFPIGYYIEHGVYIIVSDIMQDGKLVEVRRSELYRTQPFYNPKPNETIPLFFGTIFSEGKYAEVLFLKEAGKENGRLEIKLFGENKDKLFEFNLKIKNRIEHLLKTREKLEQIKT